MDVCLFPNYLLTNHFVYFKPKVFLFYLCLYFHFVFHSKISLRFLLFLSLSLQLSLFYFHLFFYFCIYYYLYYLSLFPYLLFFHHFHLLSLFHYLSILFFTTCIDGLTEYASSPPESRDYQKKDSILVAIATCFKILHDSKAHKAMLEPLIITHILPEFKVHVLLCFIYFVLFNFTFFHFNVLYFLCLLIFLFFFL